MNLEIDGVKVTGRDREIEETLAEGGVAKVRAKIAAVEVICPGSETKLAGIPVMVSEVCIRSDGSVSYLIKWIDGRTLNSAWVTENELGDVKTKRLPVGFREVAA